MHVNKQWHAQPELLYPALHIPRRRIIIILSTPCYHSVVHVPSLRFFKCSCMFWPSRDLIIFAVCILCNNKDNSKRLPQMLCTACVRCMYVWYVVGSSYVHLLVKFAYYAYNCTVTQNCK